MEIKHDWPVFTDRIRLFRLINQISEQRVKDRVKVLDEFQSIASYAVELKLS